MVETTEQHSNRSEESFKKEALLRAIAERKKVDPMVGLKLGSQSIGSDSIDFELSVR